VRIDKTSEVPVHLQLREQIILNISTGDFPIGHVMPSVRDLERRLHIHRNTISDVYAELVAERWLVREKGRRLVVVHRTGEVLIDRWNDLDWLVEGVLRVAEAKAVPLQQLVEQVRERARARPPDRLLIVEPDHGMGEQMKHEVRRAIGCAVEARCVDDLQRRPELLEGAKLAAPVYLIDLLGFVPAKQRYDTLPLIYSSIAVFDKQIRDLTKPSVIALLSVSKPGMKTIHGTLADAIGERHSLCLYWMDWPQRDPRKPAIFRMTIKAGPPPEPVRLPRAQDEEHAHPPLPQMRAIFELIPAAVEDLIAVDLLFCDSIAFDLVQHPNRMRYQLLSEQSLREIAALKLPLKRTNAVF